ncbi:MAG: hypothetical protein ACRDSQ_23400 [Actinokineospora sp.]
MVQALLSRPAALVVLGVLALLVLAREAGLVTLPVPENRRLVPEDVQHKGRVLGPLQFGFEMGTGMRTYSPSAVPHLVLIASVLVVPFTGVIAMAVGWGLARWIMAAASIVHDDDGEWSLLWQRYARLLAVATTAGAITALALGLLS